MNGRIDLSGMNFGRLAVMKRHGTNKHKKATWLCLCECGNEAVVITSKLRSGHTKSCGCLQKERTSKASIGHGFSQETTEYNIWAAMIQRCENTNCVDYDEYGGRGIKVCDEWKSFGNFISDMGERPSLKHTLERKNNDKGYCKNNCVWDNRTTQSRNQRLRKDNTTGVRGVQWDYDRNKYRVTISNNRKKIYIGLFGEMKEAKEARKRAELKYWGKSSV